MHDLLLVELRDVEYYRDLEMWIKQVRCNLQVTLCDPYLSALSVRYYNKGAI